MSGMGIIREHVETLGVNLAWWDDRSDDLTRAQTAVRQAGGDALIALDAAAAALQEIRWRLVREIKAADDATAARVSAMVEQRRERTVS